VLDYKIKELRRQIEPREQEIKSMRTQTEEMDVELEQYHKSNAALKLMIGELKCVPCPMTCSSPTIPSPPLVVLEPN
jgi:hypothetical protein